MFGRSDLSAVASGMRDYAERFEPALLSGADAAVIARQATQIANIASSVAAAAAKRAAECSTWRQHGERNAAHHWARTAGIGVGQAQEMLSTAERMESQPALKKAAAAGELSPAQAAAVSDAAAADPSAEGRLVEKAKRASLAELRDECARTKSAAQPDDEARRRAIHAGRFARKRDTRDGGGEILYRSTLDEIARVWAVITGYANVAFDSARRDGRHEPEAAYLADGVLGMAEAAAAAATGHPTPTGPAADTDAGTDTGSAWDDDQEPGPRDADEPKGVTPPTAPANPTGAPGNAMSTASGTRTRSAVPAKIIIRIDWEALMRGFTIAGETCEVAGVGPVAVSVVRDLIETGDPFLAAVVTDGVDVLNVAHLGRSPTVYQQTALQWRDPTCTVEGCAQQVRLQNDHRYDWADTHITLVPHLDRLCAHHHALKTRRGWRLVEGEGKRAMVPPDRSADGRSSPPSARAREPAGVP